MNVKGDIAEINFVLNATERGWTTFTPFTHATKVDVIVLKQGQRPITVQVKSGTPQGTKTNAHKVLVGSAKSSNRLKTNTPRYTRYQEGDFDILAIYLPGIGFSFHHLADVSGKATFSWNNTKTEATNNWEIFNQ